MKERIADISRHTARNKRVSAALLAALGMASVAVAEINTVSQAPTVPTQTLYVNPDMVGAHQCDGMDTVSCQIWNQTHGGSLEAALSSTITSQPQAIWFTSWSTQGVNGIRAAVGAKVAAAVSQYQVPQLVSYMIPFRDCQSLSAGGAPDIAQWNAYIRNFALGIKDGLASTPANGGNIPVIVLLEPDALALLPGDPSCKDKQGNPLVFSIPERVQALRAAIQVLGGAACDRGGSLCTSYTSRVKVYLDAAHAAWKGWDVGGMAQRLVDAGITDASGFFTNVSNYSPTITAETNELGEALTSPTATRGELQYGRELLNMLLTKLGGTWGTWACGSPVGCAIPPKQQIIDTSRNGIVVKWKDAQTNGWPSWCDNQLATLGDVPTLYTQGRYGVDYVAAALWVKPPGETDGCVGGSNTPPSTAGILPTDGYPAGMYYVPGACQLIGDPNCAVNVNVAPPRPRGLRISRITRLVDGASADTMLLEWNPSYGACSYQIMRRLNTTGNFQALAGTAPPPGGGTTGPGAPTSFLVAGVRHSAVSQYAVRARNCAAAGRYSSVSPFVTTRDFQ